MRRLSTTLDAESSCSAVSPVPSVVCLSSVHSSVPRESRARHEPMLVSALSVSYSCQLAVVPADEKSSSWFSSRSVSPRFSKYPWSRCRPSQSTSDFIGVSIRPKFCLSRTEAKACHSRVGAPNASVSSTPLVSPRLSVLSVISVSSLLVTVLDFADNFSLLHLCRLGPRRFRYDLHICCRDQTAVARGDGRSVRQPSPQEEEFRACGGS